MSTLVTVGAVSLVVALAATPVSMAVSLKVGVVDRPGPLKPQARPVPYLGGVAVLSALVVGAVAGRALMLVPLAVALGLGIADDVIDLSPWARLAGECAVGVALAMVVPSRFATPVAVVLAMVLTVVLVNGVNFLDGIDGLSSAVVAAAAGAFALLHGGPSRDLAVGLALALVGFLVYNRPPARVYLGDGGAYLLGTALAELVAWSWAPGVRASTGLVSLIVVALPVAELTFTVIRRVLGHGALLSGDRGHSYDRMVARGWPVLEVTLMFFAAELVLGGVALGVAASHSLAGALGALGAVALGLLVVGATGGLFSPEGGRGT